MMVAQTGGGVKHRPPRAPISARPGAATANPRVQQRATAGNSGRFAPLPQPGGPQPPAGNAGRPRATAPRSRRRPKRARPTAGPAAAKPPRRQCTA